MLIEVLCAALRPEGDTRGGRDEHRAQVVGGDWRLAIGDWQLAIGEWRMVSGERRVVCGVAARGAGQGTVRLVLRAWVPKSSRRRAGRSSLRHTLRSMSSVPMSKVHDERAWFLVKVGCLKLKRDSKSTEQSSTTAPARPRSAAV